MLDNIVKEQQSQGSHRRPWNNLLDNEVEIILSHEVTNRRKPSVYSSYRMVVTGFIFGIRSSSLRLLKWTYFEITKHDQGKKSYRYTWRAGSTEGESKAEHGSISHVQEIPTNFLISDDELVYEIYPYDCVVEHKRLFELTENHVDFFLTLNYRGIYLNNFKGDTNWLKQIQ